MFATLASRNERIIRRALKKAGQLFCRHVDRVIYAADRIYVKCDVCDRERPSLRLGDGRRAS